MYINFAIGRDICILSIESNLLPYSTNWKIVLQHVKLHLNVLTSIPSVASYCNTLNYILLQALVTDPNFWRRICAFLTPKSSTSVPHQIFGAFRAYSLTTSENRCAPYKKATLIRFQRATHVKTVQNFRVLYVKAVTIRTTYITYAKGIPDLNLLVYSI